MALNKLLFFFESEGPLKKTVGLVIVDKNNGFLKTLCIKREVFDEIIFGAPEGAMPVNGKVKKRKLRITQLEPQASTDDRQDDKRYPGSLSDFHAVGQERAI